MVCLEYSLLKVTKRIIFDYCIISWEDAALKSDSLQFAYTYGCLYILCVSVVIETINYDLHIRVILYIYIYPAIIFLTEIYHNLYKSCIVDLMKLCLILNLSPVM